LDQIIDISGAVMKILLIDDHTLFRDGILLVLEDLDIQIETFEAGSYESAKTIMNAQSNLDLILLDLGLPGIGGLEALSAIRQQLPNTPVVVLSGNDDHQIVEQALNNGARGYIPKSSPAKIMLKALQLIIAGGIYVPPEILQKQGTKLPCSETTNDINQLLTPRQCDVLHMLVKGESNKRIGTALTLTESTVRAHVAAILKAFNVSNRTQAAEYARQKSWGQSTSFH